MPDWPCGQCTFINNSVMETCEMCGTPKGSTEIPASGQDFLDHGGIPAPELQGATTATKWKCGRCTFDNKSTLVNCEMCDAPREAAELPHIEPPKPGNATENTDMVSIPGGSTGDGDPVDGEQSLMDTDINMPCDTPSSMTTNIGGTSVPVLQPGLPEPLVPVVVHKKEPQEDQASTKTLNTGATDLSKDNGWTFLDNEIRIVLIGKTGVGKSTTGNNILNSKSFKSSASGSSVTRKCQMGWGNRFNRDIQVIDTPGLFDTGMSNEDITREVVKCVGMTSPGPHAFVLVIRLDRFTEEEKATVEHFIKIFGKEMLKHLIVLFTRKDDLKYDGSTLEDFVQKVPNSLKDLLTSCDNRYLAIDNRGPQEETQQDVVELMQVIDKMVESNGGGHYTNEMYEEAERTIVEMEEEQIKRSREKMQEEMQKLREEVEEELRRQEQEKLRSLGDIRSKATELGMSPDDDEWVEVFGTESIEAEAPQSLRSLSADLDLPANTSSIPMVNGDVSHPVSVEAASSGSSNHPEPVKAVITQPGSAQDRMLSEVSIKGNMASEDSVSAEKRRQEAMELKYSLERLEEEQNSARDRMRERYLMKQAEALENLQRVHQERRYRTRREMEDSNSGIFAKIFGAVKRVWTAFTSPIQQAITKLMGQ